MEESLSNQNQLIFRKLLHWTFRLKEAVISSSTIKKSFEVRCNVVF